MKGKETIFSSSSDEWSTPEDIYNALDAEFHFSLDPCSTKENHKTEYYFTKEDDGLLQFWGGKTCSAIHHIAT